MVSANGPSSTSGSAPPRMVMAALVGIRRRFGPSLPAAISLACVALCFSITASSSSLRHCDGFGGVAKHGKAHGRSSVVSLQGRSTIARSDKRRKECCVSGSGRQQEIFLRVSDRPARHVLWAQIDSRRTAMSTETDKAAIRAIIEAIHQAHHDKDAAAIVAPYAQDAAVFSLSPPLAACTAWTSRRNSLARHLGRADRSPVARSRHQRERRPRLLPRLLPAGRRPKAAGADQLLDARHRLFAQQRRRLEDRPRAQESVPFYMDGACARPFDLTLKLPRLIPGTVCFLPQKPQRKFALRTIETGPTRRIANVNEGK